MTHTAATQNEPLSMRVVAAVAAFRRLQRAEKAVEEAERKLHLQTDRLTDQEIAYYVNLTTEPSQNKPQEVTR